MRKIPVLMLLILVTSSLLAANPIVSDAWLRLLPGDLPLAGYAHIVNNGKHMLTLESASSPAFSEIQFHRSMNHDGMESMTQVQWIRIEPSRSLDFAPGGYHLMMMGRKQPLKLGERIPVTFKFDDHSSITVDFLIKGVGTP